MSLDARITDPVDVWSFDWTTLRSEAAQAIDRSIGLTWPSSVSIRNAMRDSVRAVIRDSRAAGLFTYDAAEPLLYALLLGAGLRRSEPVRAQLADLDSTCDLLTVTGKGGGVRDVPLTAGVARAVTAWLRIRGQSPGPLFTRIFKTVPRHPVLGHANTNTTAGYDRRSLSARQATVD